MNNNIQRIYSMRKVIMLSAIFFTLFYACKKDGELYPKFNTEDLAVNFTDTFLLETTLVMEDSIRTDIASANLLGIYHDSIFGLNSAAIYSEITLSGANVDFGSNPVIDSVVLSLEYQSALDFYGNLFTPMSINVFKLTEQLSNSEYYSNQDLNYDPTPIANLTYTALVNDSIPVIVSDDTVTYAPHLRIKLDDSFGQDLLDAGTITDNEELKGLVNGLYIAPTTTVQNSPLAMGDGSIIYFDVNSSLSTVILYYHNDTDTTSYSFIMNSESKKYNRFDHNYTGTDIENQLSGSNFDTTITYAQSMAGLKTKIEIPHIKTLSSIENVIINKAEIVFSLKDASDSYLQAIQTMSLTGINEEGNSVFLIDNFEGADYFGGLLNNEEKTYTFNIARHIQQLINSTEEDYGLYLIATGSAISANRSVINSAKHPDSEIKLNITYSKP